MAQQTIETHRLEAFSDGVMAVIITIMVLELKTPVGAHLADLKPVIPHLLIYALSFQVIGTYWNNHHHLLRATSHITGKIMWANLLLLFFLSLIPFFTSWLGENHGSTIPLAFFAGVLFSAAIAYTLLVRAIIAAGGQNSHIAKAIGDDYKGKVSASSYFIAIPAAFVSPIITYVVLIAVALMWFIPDRRLAE